MRDLIDHFGDKGDLGAACGNCDNCRHPKTTRSSNELHANRVLRALAQVQMAPAKGTLYKETFSKLQLDKLGFESLIEDLEQRGLVELSGDSFSKGGRNISFQRVHLTELGFESIQRDFTE